MENPYKSTLITWFYFNRITECLTQHCLLSGQNKKWDCIEVLIVHGNDVLFGGVTKTDTFRRAFEELKSGLIKRQTFEFLELIVVRPVIKDTMLIQEFVSAADNEMTFASDFLVLAASVTKNSTNELFNLTALSEMTQQILGLIITRPTWSVMPALNNLG